MRYFRYYLYELAKYVDQWKHMESVDECLDLLLNFITSDITGLPPIKVGDRLTFRSPFQGELESKDTCMDLLYTRLGYMPLRSSHVRLDPALYRDNVARTRKRYPNMEKI